MFTAVRNHFSILLACLLPSAACEPGGGTIHVAAPPAPPAEVPRGLDPLPLPPESGLTRVVLDAPGFRANITEALGWEDSQASGVGVWVSGHSERTRPICITPCEFDFVPGLHVLRFSVDERRTETVQVQVGSRRKLVRVALGYHVYSEGLGNTGFMMQIVGATAVIIGGVLWAASTSSDPQQKQLRSPGMALTLGGSAGLLLGIPLAYKTPGTLQPSTITEVALPAN